MKYMTEFRFISSALVGERKICRHPRFEFHLNNSIHFDRIVNLINSASNIWPEVFITDLKGGGDYQSSRGGGGSKKNREVMLK